MGIFLSKAIFGGLCPHKVAVLSATAIFLQRWAMASVVYSSLYSNNMEEIDNFLVLPSSSNKTQCTILLHFVFGIYSSGQDFIHGVDNNNNNNNNCLL